SVTDTLPAGVTFVSASGTGWTCSQSGGIVTCTRASLAVGAAPAITIVVTAPNEGGTLTNTASVSASTSDPNNANNTATATTTVNASADLSITKSDGVTSVTAGTATTYTITLTNNGRSTVPAGAVGKARIAAETTGLTTGGRGW